MTSAKFDADFRAIWNRALNRFSSDVLTPELIRLWSDERGLSVINIEEQEVGAFVKTPAIVLTVEDVQACFPKFSAKSDPSWTARHQEAEQKAALWESIEWFCPLWIPVQEANKIINAIRRKPKEQAIKIFDYHTSTLYNIPFQAVCIAQIMPQARSLKDFSSLAREAFLAFYSGYQASSISALIPAIEGSLTRILSTANTDLSVLDKVDQVINRSIDTAIQVHYGKIWIPKEFKSKDYLFCQDECVYVFETYRRWLKSSFFQRTGEYDGATWLNRHMFAHGTNSDWQQSANFGRLVVALATMAFIESWHDGTGFVSPIFPSMNEDGELLWQQGLFQASRQMNMKLMEERRYHKRGRLVPEMPLDDGVTLRKAILSDDCIRDLVRPLREAGWKVDIGEPDERALHIIVSATAQQEQFKVALLYSCATDNKIYRNLANDCHAILYRGAPYHQQQFAYGIDVHVGPVTGWQAPLPPGKPHVRRLYSAPYLIDRLKSWTALSITRIKYIWRIWHS